MLGGLIEDATASAETAGIQAASNLVPCVRVSGDASLLRTVILNLLGNAVKHNHVNGRVAVDLTRNHAAAHLEFANTALVIPPGEREEIFERFRRGRDARNAARKGTGLGLSLAREIITAHGGALLLADDHGDGLVRFVAMSPTERELCI